MKAKMETLKGFDEVYCDASFFIALFSKKYAKHKRALELFKEIKENRIAIHTSWFVISEAMTVLLYQYGYSEALTFDQRSTFPPSDEGSNHTLWKPSSMITPQKVRDKKSDYMRGVHK